MAQTRYSSIDASTATFADMIKKFGIVTVMNAKVYKSTYDVSETSLMTVTGVLSTYGSATELCELKTLKIANVTEEGPTKTITGGQSGNPLLKYGKTARLEIQDALGNNKALEAFGLILNEYSDGSSSTGIAMHATDLFADQLCIIGDSFFLDGSGNQIKVKIIFYNVLPDSLFNMNQDAEGDATVFDLNGDLLKTEIQVGNSSGASESSGSLASNSVTVKTFYSIISANSDEQ